MYPQSLLKQSYVTINKPFLFDEFDIKIEFNTRMIFYYNTYDDDSKPIKHNEMDFELVAAHELSHGLGFTTSLTDYNNVFGDALPSYLGPKIFEADNKVYMMPATAFDYMIYGGNYSTSFGDISNEIFHTGCDNTTLIDCAMSVVSNNSLGYALYYISTQSKSEIVTPDATKLQLSTKCNDFMPGQCLVHLDDAYAESPEFLMTPSAHPGETLETKLQRLNLYSVYGPMTLKIFEGMGYSTKQNQQQTMLYHAHPNA